MNTYLLSVLLGIVEGLTEFLPVSSTAHLRITEALMHLDLGSAYWKMYSIVIQLGAILALCLLFLGRIVEFLRTFPQGENRDRNIWTHPVSLTIFAFVCTAAPSLLLTKLISKHLENLTVMAVSLFVGGVIMWVVDAWSERADSSVHEVEQMSLGQAIWIGLCQTLSAVFPGASRSMTTIAAGQMAGLSRSAALEFSFLVSIPTMIAATGYDLVKTLHPGHHAAETIAPLVMTSQDWIVLAIGFVVSFIVALGVVEWFLMWVRRHGFVVFAVYRILLAVALFTLGRGLDRKSVV